ncbi:MAG: DUF502 domain-containing protein [Deltaproteobacteria bacterium]|nr:DUF502 domain-containing protein [Deltaproteobacteria bacterium]
MTRFKIFFRKSFITGFLVVVPLALSIWILWSGTIWLDEIILGFVRGSLGLSSAWNPSSYLPFKFYIPGIGIFSVVILLVVIGAFTRIYFVNYFISLGERFIGRIPLLSNLYSGLKQLLNTIFSSSKEKFNKVVLVEFPRKGIYAIGFVTGVSKGELQERTQQKVYNIFMPTTPNPTSGFYFMYPENEIIELDMTVEEAFKVIISGGIVSPPMRKKIP